jgi:uncharacterized membrane protein
MRRTLEAAGWLALIWMGWRTYEALWGAAPLPARIPIHFDLAGNPNGWGSPKGLFILPVVGLGMYLLMGLVARFPAAFNYPAKVLPQYRERAQELALDMIAWLRTEMACLFCALQVAVIGAARAGHAPELAWLMPVFLVVVMGTIAWFMVSLVRLGRPRD